MFQVELVWNREFHFVPFGDPQPDLNAAIIKARHIENSGDGARVKKTRIVNAEGQTVWQYGQLVND